MISNNNYYSNPSLKYPVIVESIIERLIIYFASSLYTGEYNKDPSIAFNRITISDTDAGENVNLTDIVQNFKRNINLLPFTVYNITDYRKSDEVSSLTPFGELGIRFNEELNSKLIIYPVILEMQFVSFFNTALDFFNGLNRINSSKMFNEMLYTLVKLNGIEKQIPFRVKFETTKGGLVSKFNDYLIQNKIYNSITTCTIFFYEYQLKSLKDPEETNNDLDNELDNNFELVKVENLHLRLGKLKHDGSHDKETEIIDTTVLNVLNHTIESIENLDTITITFNNSICDFNNSELKKKISVKTHVIIPLWDYVLVDDETKLIIKIYNRDISQETKIVLNKTIKNRIGIEMNSNYEILIN